MEQVPVGKLSPAYEDGATRVRVVYLAPARHWKGIRGDGHVLTAEFVDIDGVHIRACAFDESAKAFASAFKFNGVFRISHARLRSSRQEYTSVSHPFEIVLTLETQVDALEDDGDIEETPNTTIRIRDLVTKLVGTVVNVCGVATEIGETPIYSNSKECYLCKRDVMLVDESNTCVPCSIWDEYTDDRLDKAL